MTMYVGEELKIVVSATDFDSETLLDDADVIATSLKIYDATTAVVVDAALTWDNTAAEWYYKWVTTGLAPGTYKAQIVLTGLDNGESIEWKRIRLSKQPVAV